MSRALRCWQISRNCLALLRSVTDGPLCVSPPSIVSASVPERLWLPAWPAAAAQQCSANTSLQRGFASGPEGGSGSGHPPPDQTHRGSDATPAYQPQPSQQQSGSASESSSMGPAQSSGAADGHAAQPLEAAVSAVHGSGGVGGLPGYDGPRGDMTSVVVPSEQLEYEADALLDAWEPLMAQEELDVDAILGVLADHLGDVPGLPSPQEILDAGDVDERREKELRRQREEALKQQFAASRVRVVDQLGRSYATGKRKCSVARVWVMEGSGRITVNRRRMTDYFPALARRMDVLRPFEVTGTLGALNVMSTVRGGGSTGQAQALRHGIARALQLFDPALRPALKAEGMLTRDSRIVERKKPGLAKARKAFQWVKR